MNLKKLIQKIEELEVFLSQTALDNPKISKAPIGWHIEHSTKAIYGISKALISSEPNNYKWSFNLYRYLFTYLNYLPRGRKAPKALKVEANSSISEIKERIAKTKNILKKVALLPKNSYFQHPYFGLMDKKISLMFMRTHTHHHIKIIKDIIAKKS